MNILQTDPRRLWVRYVVAILLILIFISSTHIFALSTSDGNPGIASAVNKSGRQRMLSQRILYFGSLVRSDPENSANQSLLLETIIEFEQAHLKLTRQSNAEFGFDLPPPLRALYFEAGTTGGLPLDVLATHFISDGIALIEAPEPRATRAWNRMQERGQTELLAQLNHATRLFEAESVIATNTSIRIQNVSYVLALSVLFLEVIFIFWPAHRSIVRSVEDLEESNRKTQAALRETEIARDEAAVASQAKSEFLATMSHEVRTPINGMLGIANVMMMEDLPQRQRAQIRLIQESGGHLMEILNDILDLSRMEANNFDVAESNFSLIGALEFTRTIWESRFQAAGLTFTIQNDIGKVDMITADKTRLRQVLFNLLNNACKFTESGDITVRVQIDDSQETRMLRFEVSDTGIGIEQEQMAQLFKPFEQGDSGGTRKHTGTGLGLAISKNLVEMMDGDIGVTSRLGQGSTFWFTIPLKESTDPREAFFDLNTNAPAALVTTDGAPVKILAAEDNQVDQVVLQSLLNPLGCHVQVVDSGKRAADAALSGAYDVILMDIQMPGMDGIEATQAIRVGPGVLADIPIIAMSANPTREDQDRFLAAGLDDFISKPIDPRELYAAISRNLGDRLARAHAPPPTAEDEGPWAQAEDAPNDIKQLLATIDTL